MPLVAHRPEETTDVFVENFNVGDIDRLIAAYYAEGAVLAGEPGAPASGPELRAALSKYLQPGSTISATTRHALVAGDTALLVIDWVIEGTDPSGDPFRFPGTSTDVVRRSADGSWQCLIDNPHGIS